MKKILFAALSLVIALSPATFAIAQNVVVQWNAIASTTIISNAKEASVASGVWLACLQLAVFDAVNAIDHRFQPYVFTTNPPAGANHDAAAIAAAHRQPTPPAFGPALTPWLGQMLPFTMTSAAQFFPDEGPDALNGRQWIDDYNQVKDLGALNSTVRTPEQTEIGLFWTEHTGQQYSRAFRNLATQKGLGTLDTARLLAMLWAGYADAGIGCWNAKFHFSFWRPVTAIQAGGANPDLVGDPNWLPLASTPSHPEYPAAHGCVTGAVSTILAGYFGYPKLAFSVDSKITNTTHTFTSTTDLMEEIDHARIYAGFHYHHSVVQGRVLGIKVGHQLVERYFGQVKRDQEQ